MIDVSKIVAIDVHTHVRASIDDPDAVSERNRAMGRYFGSKALATTIPKIAEFYRERQMACVSFMVDATSASGEKPAVTNEEIAVLAKENADVVIPFASVDPHAGKAAVKEAARLVNECGMRGFKFHPNLQGFNPNDAVAYPLYAEIEALGVPVVFHSGHTGVGAGVRGGGGIRLKHSNPMLVDDVAVDFPDLTIILAHPSFPWQDEALSVCLHQPKVYIDLSGWSPKYFPANLVHYANTLLKDKVLFGSDYPVISPERWLKDFQDAPFREEVRPLILKENAVRLFELARGGSLVPQK